MAARHPLKAWIARQGLTYEQFAERAELTRMTVWSVITGRPVSWRTAQRIERATDGAIKALRIARQGRAA